MMKNFVLSITVLLLGFFNASTDRDRTKTITDKASHWPTTTISSASKESIVDIDLQNINLFFQKYPN
jgi:hypothetical protein